MKKLNEMTEAEKTEFAKQLDEALLPMFQCIEAGLLELYRSVETIMKAFAEAADAAIKKVFEERKLSPS
jgi:hypothetical protein